MLACLNRPHYLLYNILLRHHIPLQGSWSSLFYEDNFKVMSFSCTLQHLAPRVFEHHTTNHPSSLWWCHLVCPAFSHRLTQTKKAMTFLFSLIFMLLFLPESDLLHSTTMIQLQTPEGSKSHETLPYNYTTEICLCWRKTMIWSRVSSS